MIGLTDQSDYTICHCMVRLFIHTLFGLQRDMYVLRSFYENFGTQELRSLLKLRYDVSKDTYLKVDSKVCFTQFQVEIILLSQIWCTYKATSAMVLLGFTRALKSDNKKLITQLDLTTQASNIFYPIFFPYSPKRDLSISVLRVLSQPMDKEK